MSVYWKRQWWRVEVGFSWKSSDSIFGRFGGGWNWKLGFQAGGGTVIISLLIFSLSLRITEPLALPGANEVGT